MRFHRFVSTLCAASLLALSSPALAQSSHTADASALQQALQTKVSTDEANRAVVLQVLASSEARMKMFI